jgi:hypothetical protein
MSNFTLVSSKPAPGVIEPKSGIGHHFPIIAAEMFVIMNGEAQFTVDGRTSPMTYAFEGK